MFQKIKDFVLSNVWRTVAILLILLCIFDKLRKRKTVRKYSR